MDSSALKIYKDSILTSFEAVRSAHESWINGSALSNVSSASQRFCNILSSTFLVSEKKISLKDRSRPHSVDGKGRVSGQLFGSCASTGSILIYMRTAARGQPTAFKTFFNTLVHEWVHHYDFDALKDSIHCRGFSDRVSSVYKLCISSIESELEEDS